MKAQNHLRKHVIVIPGLAGLLGLVLLLSFGTIRESQAGPLGRFFHGRRCADHGPGAEGDAHELGELGGTWYWLHSPDEEKRVVMRLYNLYCVRCHGVDGRGVWDIPDVPDFTNARWQASRSDGDLARLIIEGRGAVMPPFRGTLSLEEAWGMARYLRTLVPGTEASRPDFGPPKK